MLRALVALLLLANALFFAWSRGWLDPVVGVRAAGDREPERLAQQVRPDTVRILPPEPATPAAPGTGAAVAPEARLACLEAGPFDDRRVAAAEAALAATLPSGTWVRLSTPRPEGWAVYIGRFASREALQRRAEALAQQQVDATAIENVPELEPGLLLGRFQERADAATALADLARRGVQGARLVELPGGGANHVLRVDHAEPEFAARVAGLRLDALGRGFQPCARPAS